MHFCTQRNQDDDDDDDDDALDENNGLPKPPKRMLALLSYNTTTATATVTPTTTKTLNKLSNSKTNCETNSTAICGVRIIASQRVFSMNAITLQKWSQCSSTIPFIGKKISHQITYNSRTR
ncbi:hypothetical protein GQX74_003432 [Glossina fuscipes]|nr:hypothetical protein GQX74_003432 [Glossina fuscipes]